jgi:hypothetical protein
MSPDPGGSFAPAGGADGTAPEAAAETHMQLPKEGTHRCTNCGAPVSDRYCAHCGQRVEHAVHSVWHFTLEATEDLTHADSRVWSTLIALLTKPGFLTREFLAGRRARYLPPLRLYLVLSVLFFFIASAGHHEARVISLGQDDRGHNTVNVRPLAEVDEMKPKAGETPQEREKRICGNVDYVGPAPAFVVPFIKSGCRNVIKADQREMTEAFFHNVPRAIFLFLPLLAVVMKLMYWRPRRYYVEHLLFFVHVHAFLFLLFSLIWVVEGFASKTLIGWLSTLTGIYLTYYIYAALRTVYGQGRLRTFAKFVVLVFAYLFGAALMLALTSVYSVLTL